MSVNGQDSHLPMSWVSEKGGNETQFWFSLIICVLAYSNECVRREMKREYEACPDLKKKMSKEFFKNRLKSFKFGSLIHLCTVSTLALYT